MVKISGKSIFQSAKELRQKHDIIRDDGTIAYIELFNTKEWCKNLFQVTHQTTVEGKYVNRYDVTILINGLPLVQIELKRRQDKHISFKNSCVYPECNAVCSKGMS